MSAGKALAIVGALGTVAGVGYLIARHFSKPDKDDEPESGKKPSEPTAEESADQVPAAEEPADQLAGAEPAPAEPAGAKPAPAKPAPAVESVDTPEPAVEPAGPDLAPLPGPPAPIDPNGTGARIYINKSQVDDEGTVKQSAAELLEQARKHDPHITMDELTAARLAVSEHGSGTFPELACIVDAELNRAARRGRSLFESLTHRGTFGKQGKTRRASTRQDPQMRHLWAARAVLSGKARGISRGATRFFDPATMDRQNARYRAWIENGRQGDKPASVSCDALTLLEAWSYDLGRQGRSRCPPDRSKRGRHTEAWVGPIPGVDPLRLMLMKPLPLGDMHTRHYQAARAVLQRGLQKA